MTTNHNKRQIKCAPKRVKYDRRRFLALRP